MSPHRRPGSALVVHGDRSVRRAVVEALHSVAGAGTVGEAANLEEAARRARSMAVELVLLDLDERGGLALEVAREMARAGRRVVGLFDPLLPQAADPGRLREAVRSGVADFVALPASAAEIAAAAGGPAVAKPEAGEGGRVIAFLSAKGGAGTTSLVINAAAALGDSGGDVVVCDAALPFGDAAALLGVPATPDLLDLAGDLDDPGPWASYLNRAPGANVACLASPADPYRASEVSPDDVSRILLHLRRDFDWVLVDLAPTLDLVTLAALDLADACCLVTEATPAALGRTARLLRVLAELDRAPRHRRLVVNRHASEWCVEGRVIVELLGESPQLIVPFDRSVPAADPQSSPPVLERPRSELARAIRRLTEILAEPGDAEER